MRAKQLAKSFVNKPYDPAKDNDNRYQFKVIVDRDEDGTRRERFVFIGDN